MTAGDHYEPEMQDNTDDGLCPCCEGDGVLGSNPAEDQCKVCSGTGLAVTSTVEAVD